jgi:hypothetical protein
VADLKEIVCDGMDWIELGEISGSRGGDYEDDCLLDITGSA